MVYKLGTAKLIDIIFKNNLKIILQLQLYLCNRELAAECDEYVLTCLDKS